MAPNKTVAILAVVLLAVLPRVAGATPPLGADVPHALALLPSASAPAESADALTRQRAYLVASRPSVWQPVLIGFVAGALGVVGFNAIVTGANDMSPNASPVLQNSAQTTLAIGVVALALSVGGVVWAIVSAKGRAERRSEVDKRVFELDAKLAAVMVPAPTLVVPATVVLPPGDPVQPAAPE